MRWGKVIDQRLCIGCHACTVACKAENGVPLGVTRTYVRQVDVGRYPAVRRIFQVTRCNQCDNPPCVAICPVGAMFRRADGIVDFDRRACIGCKACLAACPYDAIYIEPESKSAEKCNLCVHRLEMGLEPACVTVCPERAIVVGDLDDPTSEVSRRLAAGPVAVRRPEKGTLPKLFYVEGSQPALDPLGATAPPFYAYAQRPPRGGTPPAGGDGGIPTLPGMAAVTYAFQGGPGWDWRVSAYTWTKSLAAGAYLVPAILAAAGRALAAPLVTAASALALAFLALTGLLLVADLKHPERFWRILVRPQWRSWLARGAFLITGYGLVLTADLALAWASKAGALDPVGAETARAWLRWAGAPLATAVAVYTGFLFGQARGRDLWQSPLLPWHLFIQAALAGAAALVLLATALPAPAGEAAALAASGAAAAAAGTAAAGAGAAGAAALAALVPALLLAVAQHLLFALSEAFAAHGTAAQAAAARALRTGRLGAFFWTGLAACTAALLLGFVGGRHLASEPAAPALLATAAILALVGLALGEHAYVQAGQVPLEAAGPEFPTPPFGPAVARERTSSAPPAASSHGGITHA